MPWALVLPVTTITPRSSTVASATGLRVVASIACTSIDPEGRRRRITGSVLSLTRTVTPADPLPPGSRASIEYWRASSPSITNDPSSSAVIVRRGWLWIAIVAFATGASAASTTWPSRRSAPVGSSSCSTRSGEGAELAASAGFGEETGSATGFVAMGLGSGVAGAALGLRVFI
jgi:hypothetical protein